MLIKQHLSTFYKKIDAYCGISSIEDELISRNFLVVFDEDKFRGVLTPADVVRSPRKLAIDCLTKKDQLDADGTILFAWAQMCKNHSSALPVFEKDNFIGIIEKTNIVSALKKKIEQLEKQSLVSQKVKNEFINCLNHEIRTPLNGILGFMNILSEMDLSQKYENYQEYAGMITQNAESFLLMMNDLIEISLRQSGENLPLHLEIVSIEEIFTELRNVFQQKPLMQKKQLTLTYRNSIYSLSLMTDREKLKHILYHLLDNALKFSAINSPILFGIEKATDSLITFFVTNSGEPITNTNKQKIFDLFDKSGSGHLTIEGLGIGLTVVKYFVESLDGTIELITNKNTSTFSFSIPRMI